jgi:hypothetical protein
MKRAIVVILLSGLCFAAGCSKPTADAPGPATPAPQKSEQETQTEQKAKVEAVEAHTMKMEPAADQPIMAASPAASTPKP